MNQDQVAGVVRILVPVLCTWLAAKGLPFLGDANVVAQIISLVIAAVSVVWAVRKHTDAEKIKSAAAVDPDIRIAVPPKVIAADPKVGAVVADMKVPNVTEQPG